MGSARSASNGARFIAGMLAAIWAMLGLANAYAIVLGAGLKPTAVAAIIVNVFLVAAVSLAFVNARRWRGIMLGAVFVVTVDRIANALITGAGAMTVIIALIVLVAIGALVIAAPSARRAA